MPQMLFLEGKHVAALQTQTMKNFAAIDFETANQQRTSVCSVGIVIVRDGEIVDSYYSLIKPEPEYFQVDSKILLKNENNKVFLAFLIFG